MSVSRIPRSTLAGAAFMLASGLAVAFIEC